MNKTEDKTSTTPQKQELQTEKKKPVLNSIQKAWLQFHEEYRWQRWVVVLLLVFSWLGGAVCIQFPMYVQFQLENFFEINSVQYNYLYSVTSIPNVILPFFVGYLNSKILGPRKGLFLNIAMVFLGQFLAYYSVVIGYFNLMIVGRLLVGIGYTNCVSAKAQIVAKWFYGKEIGFASSLFMLFGKLGNIYTVWVFADYQKGDSSLIKTPILYTALICLISLVCCVLLVLLDIRYTSIVEDIEKSTYQEQIDDDDLEGKQHQQAEEEQKKKDEENAQKEKKQSAIVVMWNDTKNLSLMYWLLITSVTFGSVIFFNSINNIEAIAKQAYGLETVSFLIFTVPNLCISALVPLCSIVIDNYGRQPLMLMITFFTGITCFSMLLINTKSIGIDVEVQLMTQQILLAAFYAGTNAIRNTAVPVLVDQNLVGFAVGIGLSMINFCNLFVPSILGALIDFSDQGYYYYSFGNIGILILCILASGYMYKYDEERNQGRLTNVIKHKKK